MAIVPVLCSVCGMPAAVVWEYVTTDRELVGKDALCVRHSGDK
jgi:hypothetical protein